jgi:hypothetical protein
MLKGSKLALKGSKLPTLLHEDRTYPCQFISIMLSELVSTTVEVKNGDLQPTTDHHHFFVTTCSPQPKTKESWPTTTKHAMYPLRSPLKGKGGARNQLHLKALIAILPSHLQLQKSHGKFLL